MCAHVMRCIYISKLRADPAVVGAGPVIHCIDGAFVGVFGHLAS